MKSKYNTIKYIAEYELLIENQKRMLKTKQCRYVLCPEQSTHYYETKRSSHVVCYCNKHNGKTAIVYSGEAVRISESQFEEIIYNRAIIEKVMDD